MDSEIETKEEYESKTPPSHLKADFVFTVLIGAFVFVMFYDALDYVLMSAIAPYIVLVPLSLLVLVHTIRLARNIGWNELKQFIWNLITLNNDAYMKFGSLILFTIICIVMMYLTDYYLASALYIVFMLFIIAKEKLHISLSLAIILPIALYVLFEIILSERLYRGLFSVLG